MIVKQIKRGPSSRFSALANYIMDKAHDGKKIDHAWSVNCSDDLGLASIEIEACQKLNTRAKSGKTDHLIVSFPEGYQPSLDTLKGIESELIESLGLGNHQRICALHKDTENLHLHIAISKINPHTHRIKDPFQSHKRLQKACRNLEKKYGIEPDRVAKEHTSVIEQKHGLVSFQKWLVDNVRDQLKSSLAKTASWQDVHSISARHGCNLKRHGRGLVFSHISDDLHVKASSIDQDFSLGKLEDQLGPYTPPSPQSLQPSEQVYKLSPISVEESAHELFETYKKESRDLKQHKSKALEEITKLANEERRSMQDQCRVAKGELKLDKALDSRSRRSQISALNDELKVKLKEITKSANQKRAEVRKLPTKSTWKEWLVGRAEQGDVEALAVLRTSGSKQDYAHGNFISSETLDRHMKHPAPGKAGKIRVDGGVVMGESGIIDYGSHLKLMKEEPEAIKEALSIARERFEKGWSIHGSDRFVDRCNSLKHEMDQKHEANRKEPKVSKSRGRRDQLERD